MCVCVRARAQDEDEDESTCAVSPTRQESRATCRRSATLARVVALEGEGDVAACSATVARNLRLSGARSQTLWLRKTTTARTRR